MNLTIQRLSPKYAKDTVRLFGDVLDGMSYYNNRAKREESAKYSADKLLQMCDVEPDSILIAILSARVVGYCFSNYDDGVVWASWLGVAPEHRRAGIGLMLLSTVIETLPARRAHKIWCDIRTENVQSRNVLVKMGFRKIVTLTNHWYGQDFDLWELTPLITEKVG